MTSKSTLASFAKLCHRRTGGGASQGGTPASVKTGTAAIGGQSVLEFKRQARWKRKRLHLRVGYPADRQDRADRKPGDINSPEYTPRPGHRARLAR